MSKKTLDHDSVKFEPEIIQNTKTQLSESDLSKIDQQYFAKHVEEFTDKSTLNPPVLELPAADLVKPTDLNFIDEQFFSAQTTSEPLLNSFSADHPNASELQTFSPFLQETECLENGKFKIMEETKSREIGKKKITSDSNQIMKSSGKVLEEN